MQSKTHDARYVAAALVAAYVPQALMGLFSGTIADRLDRKILLVVDNFLAAGISVFLAISVLNNFATPALVIGLLFLAGFLNSISFPAWQAFIADIVPKDKVPGALSLMFAQWNLGRIVGPAFAALLITGGHYSTALFVNTGSFFFVIFMLLLVRKTDYQAHHDDLKTSKPVTSLVAGWKFIFSSESGLRTPFIMYVITVFWASPFIALIPNVADVVFHNRSFGTALITTTQGIGAVIVSVMLTTLYIKYGHTRTQQFFLISLPFVLVSFGLAPNLVFAAPCALLFGVTYLGTLTSTTLSAQLASPPTIKGRVSAAYMTVLGILFPICSLLAGQFTQSFGSRKYFVCSGIILMILILIFGGLKSSYKLPEAYSSGSISDETLDIATLGDL